MVGSASVDPELVAVFRELVDVVSGSPRGMPSVNSLVAQQQLHEAATCIQRCWRGILARCRVAQLQRALVKLRLAVPKLVQLWRYRTWRRVRARLQSSANLAFVNFNTLGRPGELAAANAWLRHASVSLDYEAQLLRSRCQALQATLDNDMEVAAVRIQAHQRRRTVLRQTSQLVCRSQEAVAAFKAGWHRLAAQRLLLQLRDDRNISSAIMIQAHQRRHMAMRQASFLRHRSLEAMTADPGGSLMKLPTRQTGAIWAVNNHDGKVIYVRRIELAQRYLAQQRRRISMRRELFLQNRLVEAITAVQARWRRVTAQRHFLHLQEDRRMASAAIVIQAHQRRRSALHQSSVLQLRYSEAIIAVQAGWRLFGARNHLLHLQENRRVVSAVVIQANQRRRVAWRHSLVHRCWSIEAVATLKAGWHRLAAQQYLSQLREDKKVTSAITIQAHHRRRIAVQQTLVLRCRSQEVVAAVKAGFRRLSAQYYVLQIWEEQGAISAKTIQAAWRCHRVRKIYLGIKGSRSCMELAAIAKRRRERHSAADVDALGLLLGRTGAALTLQSWWRLWMLGKNLPEDLNHKQTLSPEVLFTPRCASQPSPRNPADSASCPHQASLCNLQDESGAPLSETCLTTSTVSDTSPTTSTVSVEPGPEPSPQHRRDLAELNFKMIPPNTPRARPSTFCIAESSPRTPQALRFNGSPSNTLRAQPSFAPESGTFWEVPQEATRSCWLAKFLGGGGCSLKRGRRSLVAAKLAAQRRRQAPRRLRYGVLLKEAVAVLPKALVCRIGEDVERAILVLPQPQHRESWGWPESKGFKPQTILTHMLLAYEWRVTKMTVTKRVGAVGQFEAYEYSMGLSFLAGLCLGFLCGREEDAFWLLVHVLEDIYGPAYFSRTPPLLGLQGDCAVVTSLIQSRAPRLARILGPDSIVELSSLLGKHCLSCGLIGCLADESLLTVWEQVLDRRCASFPRLPLLTWMANLVGLCEEALIRLSQGARTVDVPNSCLQHLRKQGPRLPMGARLHSEFPEFRARELARLAGRPLARFFGGYVDAGGIPEQHVV